MDLRISLLNFNFAMIYAIHKILVLMENLKDISKLFFKKCNRLLFFSKSIFFIIYNHGKSKVWKRKNH